MVPAAMGHGTVNPGFTGKERQEVEGSFMVHPSSYVDPPCEIGEGTKIWHFCHVMPRCRIGKRCNLGQNVHVASDVNIGNNVKIQNNVSLYTGVVIEDDVFLGPSCVFTNILNPRAEVVRRHLYEKTIVRRGALGRGQCHHRVRHRRGAICLHRRRGRW